MLHLVSCSQRHADGSDHSVVRRYDDPFSEDLRKSCGNRVVISRASLEEDDVADLSPTDNTIEIVQRNRLCEPGAEIADCGSTHHESGEITLHEDRAALTHTG